MLGKVFLTGKSFGETCAYVCERQSMAQVLDARGIRAHNQRVISGDLEWQHQLMPDKEKPVFHAALTFSPGEEVTNEKLVEIGRKYMQKIGMGNTQYVFVKHMDKAHLHVHIVANRVGDDCKPTGKGLVIERSIKAAEELTREYGLKHSQGKRLSATRLEALHEPDVKRYRIYQAIEESLPRCRGLDDLEKDLLRKGITMRYRRDKETGEQQGISFRLENRSFKGSQVDRTYSLKGLERKLVLQQTMLLREKEQQVMMMRLKQSMKQEKGLDRLGQEEMEKRTLKKQDMGKRLRPDGPDRRDRLQGEEELRRALKEKALERRGPEKENRAMEEEELRLGQELRRGQRPHF